MEPMYLKEIEAATRENPLLEGVRRRPLVPQIYHLLAFKPDATRHLARFTQEVLRGPSPLSPGLRELIAAFTSRKNRCRFWTGSHAAVAAELLGDAGLVDKALEDHRASPLGKAEKALLDFAERVTAAPADVRREDVEALRRAGWSEEAIYDAITVCALFNFYNRWCDAAGVHDLPAKAYQMAARETARRGYTFGDSEAR
jgi:uncharacterized peroxidase-related enzyme